MYYRKWIARMRNNIKGLLDHYELLDKSPKWNEIYLFHLIYSSIWSAIIKWFRLDSTHPILLICSIISLLHWRFIPSIHNRVPSRDSVLCRSLANSHMYAVWCLPGSYWPSLVFVARKLNLKWTKYRMRRGLSGSALTVSRTTDEVWCCLGWLYLWD